MWQAYQYGHGKLKLQKDLKTGQAHLRVSLIQQEQIENIGKIYNNRKQYYRINSNSSYTPQEVQETQEEQGMAHLSYKEKVDIYRKRLQSQKQQAKYNTLFKKIQKRRFKMRNPVLHKMLQNFEEKHKTESQLNIISDLKQSQKNLEMIKVNTNRRMKYKKTNNDSVILQRPRFLSLQNGLPQKQRQQFPKWTDYIASKMTKNQSGSVNIDINHLESIFDGYVKNHPIKRPSMHKQNSFLRDILSPRRQRVSSSRHAMRDSSVAEEIKPCDRCKDKDQNTQKMQASTYTKGFKSKTAQNKRVLNRQRTADIQNNNADKTFVKSQSYSKAVIQTMTGFYDSKTNKQKDYTRMAFYLKNDRPLTCDIRRKNYKIVGQQNIEQLKKYRNYSQAERKLLRESNYQFYMNLLKYMQKFDAQNLTLSNKIIQKIRVILQSNYIVDESHYHLIAESSLYESGDEVSDYLLGKVEELIKQRQQNQ